MNQNKPFHELLKGILLMDLDHDAKKGDEGALRDLMELERSSIAAEEKERVEVDASLYRAAMEDYNSALSVWNDRYGPNRRGFFRRLFNL